MSATPFTLDDLTLEYSQEDYKPQSREPRCDIWYEFQIASAKIEVAKQGHLTVKVQAEALDSNGKDMFKKYLNVPVPVSIRDEHVAPAYAKGLWLMNMTAFYPEVSAYDRIEKDPVTMKLKYYKGDTQLAGDEYSRAMTEQNQIVGAKAKDAAKVWLEHGDGAAIDELHGKRFFGKLVRSKDGKYTNVDRPYHVAPENEDVCYDRKEALKN